MTIRRALRLQSHQLHFKYLRLRFCLQITRVCAMCRLVLTNGNQFVGSVTKLVTLRRDETRNMAFLQVILLEAKHLRSFWNPHLLLLKWTCLLNLKQSHLLLTTWLVIFPRTRFNSSLLCSVLNSRTTMSRVKAKLLLLRTQMRFMVSPSPNLHFVLLVFLLFHRAC